jgi:ABC-2 type transport system permease protein
VTAEVRELVGRGIAALRRSAAWWAIGIGALVLVSAGFWPSLEGSDALTDFEDMGALLEAFGAQNIATPAGYLDGQLYALMLPLLLSGFAVAAASAVTSGDEDAGRLELLHALPVSRRAVWLSRWGAVVVVVAVVALVLAALAAASLRVFSLDGVGAGRVVAVTFACALLALFHAAVAFAAGGLGASRGRAIGIAVAVLVAGYVVDFLVPLADGLAGLQQWSPWWWAIGEQPVSDGVLRWRLVLLVALTALLVAAGTAAVERRDIRGA